MVIEKHVTADARFVVANPEENVAVIFACVFIQGVAISQGHLSATIVFIELEVDHAGNRIRSVSGRSAVFQNFDALGSRNGNAIQIDETEAGVGSPGEVSDTAAIDQNQRGAGVETTQRDRRGPRWTSLAGPIIIDRNTARTHHRLTLEKLFRGGALT